MRTGLSAMKASAIEFADIHRRIDPQAVLDHYGAENDREEINLDGTREVIHSCLIDRVDPHHQNGDQNPSAACNLDKKTYVCYSYVDPETGKSGYDMLRLIMKLEGAKDARDVMGLVQSFMDGASPASVDDRIAKLRRLRAPEPTGAPETIRAYSERMLAGWAYAHPYLEERGVDLDTASRLQIGYDAEVNRITIPHFWGGRLVGWQKRAVPDRPGEWPGTVPAIPKYKSSPGFPKSETLYRMAEAATADLSATGGFAVVVESPFSVIKAEALGLRGVVATFGAKITDTQVDLLAGFDRLIVWMDDDDAGYRAERRLNDALPRGSTLRFVTPDKGRDLADCATLDEALAKIDQADTRYARRRRWATKSPA
ncbi:DNA primase [Mycobacterium phage ScoobyDoobyDoo]|nr:DNA primase [Mycobacterium phage ScoobyDoobyDoo]